ncbi:MAG TPA: glycine betaine ABC transporter substrate-binding protein [Solirubrobacteraceae bacterium]|jgi:osmoprotectant transport system substrate-binding protein|nr:glycine betaine ABC transporter substrate-binding protein [Solirubrobacteraceae bacterium]
MRFPGSAPTAARLAAAVLAAVTCAACGSSRSTSSPSLTTTTRTTTSSTSSAATATTSSQSGTATDTTALPGTGKPVITVGDKNFAEQFVLGQLYVQALRAQGYSVNINQNIGPTDVTVQALQNGSLTVYPEYLNTFNTAIAGYHHGFHTLLDAYQGAQHYALDHGMQVLAPSPFSNTDAIAVTVAYAADNRVRSIGDLNHLSAGLTVGGPPQFQTGSPGLPDLNIDYGFVPIAYRAMAVGDQYAALNSGTIQAADVNSTDGQLATGDYMLMRDPRRTFGWGNVVPVVSGKAAAAEGSAFTDTIQRVDDTLTTDVMRQLNYAVSIAGQDPAAVARQFLQTHGLLTPPSP